MNLQLQGRVAIVTAASKGIGQAIAKQLASEGANLIIISRNQEKIQAFAEHLRSTFDVDVSALAGDLSDASVIDHVINEAKNRYGRVDALVCNAGGPPAGSFLDITDEQWTDAFSLSLMSVVRLVRGVYPLMQHHGGRIIAIASSSVKVPIPGLVLSNTYRTAVVGLMKTLSIELAKDQILVNTVCPGRIATDRLTELDTIRAEREGRELAEVQEEILQDIPLGRYGRPEEFAQFASYLLSPANTYMTGSTFYIDGGMVKAL